MADDDKNTGDGEYEWGEPHSKDKIIRAVVTVEPKDENTDKQPGGEQVDEE